MNTTSFVSSVKIKTIVCALSGLVLMPAQATTTTLADALKQGTINAQFRYRLENADQDNALKTATASTLRSRLTLQSGSWFHAKALFELDNISSIGGEGYNSGVNGSSHYSAITDPTGTDINQAALLLTPNENSQLTLGRQRINLQNQRFIGSVGWRQNEQTFDGVRLTQQLGNQWQIDLSSLHNANRIFGPKGADADLHGRFALGQLKWQPMPQHTFTVFHYDLDFDTLNSRDSLTQGLDYTGYLAAFSDFKWLLVFADQEDKHRAPLQFQHHYHRIDLSYTFKGITGKLVQERLGGDGQSAFQTPFATLHAFQGFTDVFLVTPTVGIRDHYLEISLPLSSANLSASWHSYHSDAGSSKLGTEINSSVTYDLLKQLNLMFKLSHYQADSYGVDTNKLWLMATYSI